MMTALDPYETLGVDRNATPEQIRAAFRQAVRRQHPDTSGPNDGAAVRDVIEAYRMLGGFAQLERHSSDHRAPDRRDEAASVGSERQRGDPVNASSRTDATAAMARSVIGSCARCGGRRQVAARSVCPECRGAGRVAVLNVGSKTIERCPTCDGMGSTVVKTLCPGCGAIR